MENQTNNTAPEEAIADEKLEEVTGGARTHDRWTEQLETQESTKGVKEIDLQKIRLDELDRRDSSK